MRARRPSLARLRQGFSPAALVMYAATLTLELPVVVLRLLLAYILALIALAITGHPAIDANTLSLVALLPTLWSVLALAWPGGSGWWWRQQIGGRRPSQREQLAYHDALELLRDNTREPLTEPGMWFVLDTPEPDAAVLGNTLMLSRGLLESPHLPAVLAHELGHLATPDGQVTAALNRLVIHPAIYDPEPQERHHRRQPPLDDELFILIAVAVWAAKKLLAFLRGGLGLYLLHPIWGHYWRRREYTADQHAATLGQADELADFLEIHALLHDHPIPYIWLTDHTHPPTELRIDQLRTHAHPDPEQAT